MKPEFISSNEARIDAALRLYGHAVPVPGLEARVAARISAVSRSSDRGTGSIRFMVVRRFSMAVLSAAAACAIVMGSVQHSHKPLLPPLAHALQSGGIATANAKHVPTHAIPPATPIDPQAPRTAPHSRAPVSPNAGNSKKAIAPSTTHPSSAERQQ